MTLSMTRPFHIHLYGADRGPIPTSFEEVAERLGQLDQLYFEPDGSFCWSPSADENIFGMVYDAASRVQYIELRGKCEIAAWRGLMTAIRGDYSQAIWIMCLQKRQLQELQSFEESCWSRK